LLLFLAVSVVLGGAGAVLIWQSRGAPPGSVAVPEKDPDRLVERNRLAEEARRLALDGKPADALAVIDRKLALERGVLGEDHADLGDSLMLRADMQRDQGDVAGARSTYGAAAASRAKQTGPDHWQAREARASLADLDRPVLPGRQEARELYRRSVRLYDEGKYAEAIRAGEEALALFRCSGGSDAEVADGLAHLGLLYGEHGDHYPRTEKRLKEARDALEKARGRDHPAYACCLRSLAGIVQDRGDFAAAEKLYNQALNVLRQARGERTIEYARTLKRLGRLHAAWSVWDAQDICMRALQVREQILGKDHPDCADSLIDLGILALSCSHFDKAVQLLTDALGVQDKALGKGHPLSAETLSWLGQAYTERCRHTEARRCHRQALLITRRARGDRHLACARCLSNFAWLCQREHDGPRARRLARQALAIREALGCGRHPDYAADLVVLAHLLEAFDCTTENKDFRAAEKVYDQALALLERIPAGKLLPSYPRALCWLAGAYYWDDYQLKPPAYADQLCERALSAMRRQQAGREVELHPSFHFYLVASARVLTALGRRAEAEQLFRQQLEVRIRLFGPDDPHSMCEVLSGMYTHQMRRGLHDEARPLTRQGIAFVERLARMLNGQAERSRLAALTYHYLTLSCALTAAVGGKRPPSPDDVTESCTATRWPSGASSRPGRPRTAWPSTTPSFGPGWPPCGRRGPGWCRRSSARPTARSPNGGWKRSTG
jgi:tetratricopeptide (TPR) repeat protein